MGRGAPSRLQVAFEDAREHLKRALFLCQFDFTLTYRPGSKNVKPDALSCQFSADPASQAPEPILPLACVIGSLSTGFQPPLFDYQEAEAAVPLVRAHLHRCRRVWRQVSASLRHSSVHSELQANQCRIPALHYCPRQRVWLKTSHSRSEAGSWRHGSRVHSKCIGWSTWGRCGNPV